MNNRTFISIFSHTYSLSSLYPLAPSPAHFQQCGTAIHAHSDVVAAAEADEVAFQAIERAGLNDADTGKLFLTEQFGVDEAGARQTGVAGTHENLHLAVGDGGIVEAGTFALEEIELYGATTHQLYAPLAIIGMMDENQIVDGRDKPADTLHSVGLSVHKFIFEGKEIFYLFVEQEVGQIEFLII